MEHTSERAERILTIATQFEAAMLQGLVANGVPLGNGIGKTTINYNDGYETRTHYIQDVALIHAAQLFDLWEKGAHI